MWWGRPISPTRSSARWPAGRLCHAYLFTGTRGTGKTTCAKILARAVNCEHPVDGNPCNQCPACLGIENGSILDVLELDAASNNGVDQVRALRDEAVYTPAAVRKRVYIVDEVHMLSTAAFNALLKILEEPPGAPHVHSGHHGAAQGAGHHQVPVPAVLLQTDSPRRHRCQRLAYVAGQEGIDLTAEGAALLARLADGGLRDALSLLDQCAGRRAADRASRRFWTPWGWRAIWRPPRLMEQHRRRETPPGPWRPWPGCTARGRTWAALLGELSALTRDLLMRKTAPQGGAALLTGGYDEDTMRRLSEQFQPGPAGADAGRCCRAPSPDLSRSGNRRTDAELCLIRLCDPSPGREHRRR